jgi:hypothetical protein
MFKWLRLRSKKELWPENPCLELPDPKQWDDPHARAVNRAFQTGKQVVWNKGEPLPEIPDKSKWMPLEEE